MKDKRLLVVIGSVCLILVLAALPFLAACAGPAPAPTQAPAPTPEKPVELIFQAVHPRPQYLTQTSILPWVMGLEEKSGGRIKTFYYDSGGVVPRPGEIDAIAANVLQMGVVELAIEPGRYPATDVMLLPLIAPSSAIGSLVAWHMFETFPEWRANFPDEVKVLTHFVSATYQFHMVEEPILTLEDLKGQRIIGIDARALVVLEKLGAIPMNVRMLDAYEALAKGMADGILCPLAPIRALKVSEVVKHHTIVDLSFLIFAVPMNRSVFDSLPSDLQQLILDESGAKFAEANGKALDDGSLLDVEWMKEQGAKFHKLEPGELEKIVEIIMPLREQWVSEAEAKGLPGRELLDEALRYSAELVAQGK